MVYISRSSWLLFCHLSLYPCPDVLQITEDLFAGYGEDALVRLTHCPCNITYTANVMAKSGSIGRFNRFLSETASFVINQLCQITTVKPGAIDLKARGETALTLFVFLINCYILYFPAGVNIFTYLDGCRVTKPAGRKVPLREPSYSHIEMQQTPSHTYLVQIALQILHLEFSC